jgi:hypothetical protein
VVAFTLALGSLGLGATDANCQPKDGANQKERRAKVQKRVQEVRAIKLAETLELDEATQKKLDDALEQYDVKIFDEQFKLTRKMRRMRRGLKRGEGTDKEVDKLISEIIGHRRQLDALRIKQFEAGAKHLKPRERAQLLLFLPQFEKQVKKAIRNARGKNKGERKGRRGRRENRR